MNPHARSSRVSAWMCPGWRSILVFAVGCILVHAGPSTAVDPIKSGWGTPHVNGLFSPGEWASAGTLDFTANTPGGGTAPATLFVMNDAANIYLAVRYAGVAPYTANSLGVEFDKNNDASISSGDDAIVFSTGVGFFDDFRTSTSAYLDTNDGGTNDGGGAFSNDGRFATFEIWHPLKSTDTAHDIQVFAGQALRLKIDLRMIAPGGVFPQDFGDTSFPPGFAVVITSSGPPPVVIPASAAPLAYIGNIEAAKVSIIDTATNSVAGTVPLPEPVTGVAVSPDGKRVYAANSMHAFVIDTATHSIVGSVAVGTGVGGYAGVAIDPTGTRVYVTSNWNQNPHMVKVIDTATNRVVAAIPVGDTPVGVAVHPAGTRAYVTNMFSDNISVIDTAANTVIANIDLSVGSPCGRNAVPFGIAINASGTRAYVANQNCMSAVGTWYTTVIDTTTNSLIAHVASGTSPSPRGVAVSPDGSRVYVSNGAVIDTTTQTMVASFPGSSLNGLALNPDGTRAYVPVLTYDSPGYVLVVDTTTYAVVATVNVGGRPISFGQFVGPAVVTPPGTKLDLNQHGLTGSWYEPVTSGQGIEVEMFPDLSPGTGSTFVSWFTYDTIIGGVERQRWYTAQGPVVTGQPNAALTIYRNAGGNFNAPPVTTAQVVGTATLSFDTCASGQLAYAFTDGTGRTGRIPLTRLTQNATCSTSSARPTNADFALSGNWYDTATSGQGLTVEVSPNSGAFFAAWYTYAPNGVGAGVAGQRWYTAQAAFTPGLRSMPVTIYETTGGVFDEPTPPGQKTVPVGTGTMAFQTCSAATFSYNFTGGSSSGLSGTIPLSRVGPVPPGCAM